MTTAVWHVYMIECAGGRLYTGITPDVAARFDKHRAGKGAAFTRINKPLRILAAEPCGSRSEALRREHALKRLPREEKLSWAKGSARWGACEQLSAPRPGPSGAGP